jgi:hypothetical protein
VCCVWESCGWVPTPGSEQRVEQASRHVVASLGVHVAQAIIIPRVLLLELPDLQYSAVVSVKRNLTQVKS